MSNPRHSFSERYEMWDSWHTYVLHAKCVHGEEMLRSAVLVDHASSEVAVRASLSEGVVDVLERTRLPADVIDTITSSVPGDRIDHIGFRIHAPMDVYMELLSVWADMKGRTLVGTKRFAPSATLQDRVGTSAEMAQVWLESPDGLVEIELFDIHRPVDTTLAPFGAEAQRILDGEQDTPHPADWGPFKADDIWHYGIRLSGLSDVKRLHESLGDVVEASDDLALRNKEVVVNLWHGSHHTKLANKAAGTEIELLAYIEDWDA